MNSNEALIERFYTAFKNSDAAAMAACYHPEVEFSDPGFPGLKGRRARGMWGQVCQRKAAPASRTFENIKADGARGSAHWEARYNFPLNGRPVHNVIDAEFEFEGGLIRRY